MYIRPGRRGFQGLGDSGVSTIAATIQQIEGYKPGSISYINNNPGNLIFVGQPGASQGTPMAGTPYYFASFPSYDAGYAALQSQIQNYANQGLTINQMMAKYAPATDANGNPTGNNPTAYANSIASSLGVSPDTTVSAALAGGSSLPDSLTSTGATDFDTLFPSDDSVLSDLSSSGTVDPTLLIVGGLLFGLVAWQLA